jgi:hypothetical protein
MGRHSFGLLVHAPWGTLISKNFSLWDALPLGQTMFPAEFYVGLRAKVNFLVVGCTHTMGFSFGPGCISRTESDKLMVVPLLITSVFMLGAFRT